ncbi:acyltransferase family protein [Mesorhizobium sp. M0276]
MSVHVAHMPQPGMEMPWFDLYIAHGVWGVQLFFVVSTFSLCLMQPSHADEDRPLLGFALRRFFRIAPLFYLLVAFTLLSVFEPMRDFFNTNPSGFALNIGTFLTNVTFVFNLVPGYGHQTSIVMAGWTTGTEMMFYLIFPFVYARTKKPVVGAGGGVHQLGGGKGLRHDGDAVHGRPGNLSTAVDFLSSADIHVRFQLCASSSAKWRGGSCDVGVSAAQLPCLAERRTHDGAQAAKALRLSFLCSRRWSMLR